MSLFLSTFVHKIDKKGRVSVPAQFRAALASDSYQGIISFKSYQHPTIECCSHNRMVQISNRIDHLDLSLGHQDDLTTAIFADSHYVPFDSEGRIILPRVILDHAHIVDSIAFVGRGQTFQLWQPDTFEKIQQQARARVQNRNNSLNAEPGLSSKHYGQDQ